MFHEFVPVAWWAGTRRAATALHATGLVYESHLLGYLCVTNKFENAMSSNFVYPCAILDGWRLNKDVSGCVKTILSLCTIMS